MIAYGTALIDETTKVFQSRNNALSDPRYDLINANAYLEMYDSILSPQMLILHKLSLIKWVFLSKNEHFSSASVSMTVASDSHSHPETCVGNQLFHSGPTRLDEHREITQDVWIKQVRIIE